MDIHEEKEWLTERGLYLSVDNDNHMYQKQVYHETENTILRLSNNTNSVEKWVTSVGYIKRRQEILEGMHKELEEKSAKSLPRT